MIAILSCRRCRPSANDLQIASPMLESIVRTIRLFPPATPLQMFHSVEIRTTFRLSALQTNHMRMISLVSVHMDRHRTADWDPSSTLKAGNQQ